jgi:hypothetical protein
MKKVLIIFSFLSLVITSCEKGINTDSFKKSNNIEWNQMSGEAILGGELIYTSNENENDFIEWYLAEDTEDYITYKTNHEGYENYLVRYNKNRDTWENNMPKGNYCVTCKCHYPDYPETYTIVSCYSNCTCESCCASFIRWWQSK